MKASTTRDEFLAPIRTGLCQNSHGNKPKSQASSGLEVTTPVQSGDLALQFKRMLELVGGECEILDGSAQLPETIQRWIQLLQPKTILTPISLLIGNLDLNEELGKKPPKILHPNRESLPEAANSELGITLAFAAIADTGTVVLMHHQEMDRLSALLPTAHLVLVDRCTLFPNKIDCLSMLKTSINGLNDASMSWITGPSSTADIEKVLVRGAHGPRRLIAILY